MAAASDLDTGKNIKDDVNKKIDTAVKFLQNPRVQETPLAQRKAFLAKKGLSSEEIEEALKKAGVSDQNNTPGYTPPRSNLYHAGSIPPGNNIRLVPRWQDYFWVAVIGGGFGYTLVHLVKTYILPYFLESKHEKTEKIEELQSSVQELKETLSETVCGIQETLDSVQRLLADQQEKIQNMSLNFSTTQSSVTPGLADTFTMADVKSELSSIKGLFLGRQQFSAPLIQSSPIPRIPAWQRSDVTTTQAQPTTRGELSSIANSGTRSSAICQSTENGISSSDQDTSSGDTIEVRETAEETGNESCDETRDETRDDSFTEPSDTSFSTMSSDVGSPNLSLSELKESVSDTFVKVPTNE